MSKFDLKDRLDSILYRAYNAISDGVFFFNFKVKRLVKQNCSFASTHSGRCFILGTGPSLSSLTKEELQYINSHTVFGVNSLYKSAVGRAVSPDYYVLIDNLYWTEWSEAFSEVRAVYEADPPVFITDVRAREYAAGPGGKEPLFIHAKKYPVERMDFDLARNIFAPMNVVSNAILSAIYMGFEEIFLLGCDYNAFCTQGQGHCYDDGSEVAQVNYNLAFYLKYYHLTTEFHYLIARLASKQGVKVVNLTPGSLLDAYPRKSFQDCFKSC
ncbi:MULTISPECIES: 6-hydroxymethylpterin diphosphokinase MptE-like protein [unclassified Pseudomonas]|uniref:6-hydroxymethylpterin diphosphokinase MptE-like protein n=1 Tax=unclassified Pseudomonas TaxID=196821 RepID=UPI002898D9DB|nr:6-hydroxymethylpterin diphosphokinase MptE-like protein [Pseudomonas sp.]